MSRLPVIEKVKQLFLNFFPEIFFENLKKKFAVLQRHTQLSHAHVQVWQVGAAPIKCHKRTQQTLARMAYLENHTSVLLRVFFYRDRREKLSLAHKCANFGAQNCNCSPENFISDFLLCPQCSVKLEQTTRARLTLSPPPRKDLRRGSKTRARASRLLKCRAVLTKAHTTKTRRGHPIEF